MQYLKDRFDSYYAPEIDYEDPDSFEEIVDLCGDLAGSVGAIDHENVYTHRMPPIIPTKLTFRFTSSGTNSS